MPGVTSARPTLIVFTLGPEAEARRHPLLPERLRAEETLLRRTCLENVVSVGRFAGCRVELSSPTPLDLKGYDAWSPQRGSDFGERLVNALGSAFAHGGPALIVGADVPGLDACHISAAVAGISEDADRVVVGPSPDGGFYLLASARPLDDVLAEVRWCGGDTRRSLLAALERGGRRVVLLEPLADLDTPADLERWVASGPVPVVELARRRAALHELLSLRRRPRRTEGEGLPPSAVILPRSGRAPPPSVSF